MEIYYLTAKGEVYNADTENYIKADKNNCFKLKQTDGKYKKMALKPLYKLVFNEIYCRDNITNLSGEEWKEIEGYGSKYFVSNKGRVKSYTKYDAFLMKARKTNDGYLRLDLQQEGRKTSKLVHRIVAASFLPMPEKLDMELHHKDFNKENNSADNLEWLGVVEHKKKHRERITNGKQQSA